MRRLEFSDGKSNKFWQIAVDGLTYTVRYGRIGTDGQQSTKSFGSPEAARAAADKVLKSKLKKGYVEVDTVATSGPPEAEAAVRANPDDEGAWQVYADWLEAQGDPRGQLVRLQRADADATDWIAAHHRAFFGKLVADDEPYLRVHWKSGFWEWAFVGVDWDSDFEITELLGQVLRHPSAAFLERLEVGLADAEGENFYDPVIKQIVKHGKRPGLTFLHLGSFEYPDETEISWTEVGDVGPLWGVLPDLASLRLTGGGIELGAIHAPRLTTLFLETGGLPGEALESLARAELPMLERLEVWLGTEDYGGTCTAAQVRALLANQHGLPALRHLGLKNADLQDAVLRLLVESPLLPRLVTLDLSMGTMTSEGAGVLLEHRDRFAHLQQIDIGQNFVEADRAAAIQAVLPNVVCEHDDDKLSEVEADWRFVTVGE